MSTPKHPLKHKIRVAENPYPVSAPGLFVGRCTCGHSGLSRHTRAEAEADVAKHEEEVARDGTR